MLINGKEIAATLLAATAQEVQALKAEKNITPGLAVVLVGEDPASQVYVNSKVKTCGELGIYSRKIALPASTTQDELLEVVHQLNADPAIHGILVQSPPPKHIHEETIIRAIDPRKDVDGFHPENVAKLALEDPTGFVPCTPAGAIRLLEATGVPTAGKNVVIIGRSMIVGKPLALLLMGKKYNATVTVAHSRSTDLPAICRGADILIAAVGVPELVKADWIRPGATVIDVGINRIPDASTKSGTRLVGDVAFSEAEKVAAHITPVPGGVGPMTIALLMANTVKAAKQI